MNCFFHSSLETLKHANKLNLTERKERIAWIEKGKSIVLMQIYIRYIVAASTSQLKGNINYGKHFTHAHLFMYELILFFLYVRVKKWELQNVWNDFNCRRDKNWEISWCSNWPILNWRQQNPLNCINKYWNVEHRKWYENRTMESS